MKDNKKIKYFAYVLVIIGVSALAVSLAWISANIVGNPKDIVSNTDSLKIVFTDSQEVSTINFEPGQTITKTFTIENTGRQPVNYRIYWEEVVNTYIDQTDLYYTLTGITNGSNEPANILQKELPMNAPQTIEKSIYIVPGEKHSYTLTITFIETGSEQNDNQEKTFTGKVYVKEYKPTLYETILADNEVLDSSSINYAYTNNGCNDTTSCSAGTVEDETQVTEGLYKLNSSNTNATTERGQEIYFFRGTHNLNNNVIFAGFCWKIVRTNWDGSVKLIYNGRPTNGQCTTTTGNTARIGTNSFSLNVEANAYVGYMYGTPNSSTYEEEHANINNSTIKRAIDRWYENNLASYSEYLADPGYCGDRSLSSGTGIGASKTVYMGYNRLYTNKTPSLECTESNDLYTTSTSSIGNKALDYPIALITLDEAALAGGVMSTLNNNFYLYAGNPYWTLSPGSFNVGRTGSCVVTSDNMSLRCYYGYITSGIRPVVSLNSSAQVVSGGAGAMTNPYVIE